MVNTTVPVTMGGNSHHAAHKLGAQDRTDIGYLGNGLHTWYVSEADTHDDRKRRSQLKTFCTQDRKQLKQSADGRTEQGGLDQYDPVRIADTRHSRNYDRWRNAPYDHGYHMLQCQRKSLAESGNPVQIKNGSTAFGVG